MNGQTIGGRVVRCNWASQKGANVYEEGNEVISNEEKRDVACWWCFIIVCLLRPSYSLLSATASTPNLDYHTVLAQAPSTNTSVYVGNLASDVTQLVLQTAFAEFGTIEEVKIQPDKVLHGNLWNCIVVMLLLLSFFIGVGVCVCAISNT
jgi:hypothetical protein